MVKYLYLHNLLSNVFTLIFFAGGVVLVLVSLLAWNNDGTRAKRSGLQDRVLLPL